LHKLKVARGHIDVDDGVGVQLVDELTRLTVERKPCHIDGTV